jgi:hypothetical protein
MTALIIPNRFEGTPIDFATGVILMTHLQVLNDTALDMINSSFISDANVAVLESVLGHIAHWQTWVATHRPRGDQLTIFDPSIVEQFDLLILADYPDMAARLATVRAQIRRKKILLIGLPLAALGGFYLVHKVR